jgi:hypothetical protein
MPLLVDQCPLLRIRQPASINFGKGFLFRRHAVKADTLALTAFELGLFAWMAVVYFLFVSRAEPASVYYWFMMTWFSDSSRLFRQTGFLLGRV